MLKAANYFGTILAGQAASFMILPLATRALKPADYGQYVLVLTLVGLLGALGTSWIRNVAFRLYFENRSRSLAYVMSIGATQALITIGLGLLIVAPALMTGILQLPGYLVVTALILLVVSDLYSLCLNALRAEGRDGNFAVAEYLGATVRLVGAAFVLTSVLRSPFSLLAVVVLASGAATIVAVSGLRGRLAGPPKLDSEFVLPTLRLGVAGLPFSLGVWAIGLADRLILERLAGTASVGIYSAAYSVAERTIGGPAAAVFMIAWPGIIRAMDSGGHDAAASAITSATRQYLWATVGPLALVTTLNQDLLSLLVGPLYHKASNVLPLVAFGTWMWGLAGYVNRPLELQKRYGLVSCVTIVTAAINVCLAFLLIPSYNYLGAAVATAVAYGAGLVAYLMLTDRLQFRFPTTDALLAAGSAALAWTMTIPADTGPSRLVIFAISYTAVTATVFYLRRYGTSRALPQRTDH